MGQAYQIKNQYSLYFLTFQVVGWADIFSRKIYRDRVIEGMNYFQQQRGLSVFAYVIMTNHMHVIWQAKNGNLSNIVRDFKRGISRTIMKEVRTNFKESRREWLTMVFRYHGRFNKRTVGWQFWTHENHAVELTTDVMINQRLGYIHDNPVKAGWVEQSHHYLYSSARNYVGEKGLIEVERL